MERLGLSGPRGIRGSQTAQVRKRGGSSRVRRAETMMEGERRGGRSEVARRQGEEVRAGSEGPRWRTQGRGGRVARGRGGEGEEEGGRSGGRGGGRVRPREREGRGEVQVSRTMGEGGE